jgi:hypothetical protein
MMPRSTSLGKRKLGESSESVHRSKTAKLDGPVLIAHSPLCQTYFEQYGISTGVQYEIARLHSSGLLSYEHISRDLIQSLRGPSADAAPNVSRLLASGSATAHGMAYAQAFAKELATRVRPLSLPPLSLTLPSVPGKNSTPKKNCSNQTLWPLLVARLPITAVKSTSAPNSPISAVPNPSRITKLSSSELSSARRAGSPAGSVRRAS